VVIAVPSVGIDGISVGIDGISLGIDVPSVGIDVPSVGIDVPSLGIDVLTGGIDVPSVGIDVLTVGIDVLTVGIDVLTVGIDVLTVGIDVLTVGIDRRAPCCILNQPESRAAYSRDELAVPARRGLAPLGGMVTLAGEGSDEAARRAQEDEGGRYGRPNLSRIAPRPASRRGGALRSAAVSSRLDLAYLARRKPRSIHARSGPGRQDRGLPRGAVRFGETPHISSERTRSSLGRYGGRPIVERPSYVSIRA
jgi:hypothetical protein